MKLNSIFFTTIILILSTFISNAQNFYYSNNQKIPLTEDNTLILIKADENSKIARSLESLNIFSAMERINSKSIILRLKPDDLNNLNRLNEIAPNRTYSFMSSSGGKLIPTGEILFQPKKGVTFEDINGLFETEMTVVKKKYGVFRVFIENYPELLRISNIIYESGLVEYSHPNFIAESVKTQNDLLYPEQYYLNNTGQFGGTPGIDINAPQAWAISTGLYEVRVAVLDDGVENHIDFDGRVVQGYTEGITTGNGSPGAGDRHGQAVAGIIAASRNNNNEGIAGIAPCVNIVPVNLNFNMGSTGDRAESIDWAWDEGNADVLNNSWGYVNQGVYFDNVAAAIGRARSQGRNGQGAIVVFASGNSHVDGAAQIRFVGVTHPANVPGVLTVGAIDNNGAIHGYSSRGAEMDLVAPSGGGNVRTTDRIGAAGYNAGNYTSTFGGTSAACPQVSGVAALMLSINPNLTEIELSTILKNSATPMGTPGFDNTFGYGRLNAQSALSSALPSITGTSYICPSATLSVNVPTGGSVSWSVSPTSGALSFSQGSASTSFTRVGSYNGNATITATITSECGSVTISKSVKVGQSPINMVSFSNGADGEEYFCTSHYGNTYQISPHVSNTTYQYRLRRYPNLNVVYTSPIGQSDTGTINYIPPQGWYEFQVRTTNSCGTSPWAGYEVEYIDCNLGGGGGEMYSIYPNPASSEVNITYKTDKTGSQSLSYQQTSQIAKLFDFNGAFVKDIELDPYGTTKMDVSNLKEGMYFLKIQVREEEETYKIIVTH